MVEARPGSPDAERDLTVEDINEIFIHTAIYAGVPASNSAIAIARKVLEEEGALPPAID